MIVVQTDDDHAVVSVQARLYQRAARDAHLEPGLNCLQ